MRDMKDKMFMKDGTTPKCLYCGMAMKNYVGTRGKFKGQLQQYSWICDCSDYPKNMVLSVG